MEVQDIISSSELVKLIDEEDFQRRVEEIHEKGETYLSACSQVVEQLDIDPYDAKTYFSPILVEKLRVEASNMRLLTDERSDAENLSRFF